MKFNVEKCKVTDMEEETNLNFMYKIMVSELLLHSNETLVTVL